MCGSESHRRADGNRRVGGHPAQLLARWEQRPPQTLLKLPQKGYPLILRQMFCSRCEGSATLVALKNVRRMLVYQRSRQLCSS